jgi:hypothetical protein
MSKVGGKEFRQIGVWVVGWRGVYCAGHIIGHQIPFHLQVLQQHIVAIDMSSTDSEIRR